MNPLLRAACLSVILIVPASLFAISSASISRPFHRDSHDGPGSGYADSGTFQLDTRTSPTGSGHGDSASFVLDTRSPKDVWTIR
jgi:hypothetical protein